MANSSPLPVPGMGEPHHARAAVKLTKSAQAASKVASVSEPGPRRLIRPSLPARGIETRNLLRRAPLVPAKRHAIDGVALPPEASHAETFYLQKQAQAQTLIVFVLEDGEQIEGYIEWYDKNVIKVRNGSRTLIYKSCIKYLYKAGENIRV